MQPRRLGLLALLAAAGVQGLSRDKLLGLLWPESEPDRARHALDQSLHAIRRGLADDIFMGKSTLQLNPALVTSDLGDFLAAVAEQEWETAAGLYSGSFLDGFFLEGSRDFEEWCDLERERLGRAFRQTLEMLARMAEVNGDGSMLLRWRQRLALADPLNARYAETLALSYRDQGDVASALKVAERFKDRFTTEVGVAPPGSVTRLITQLRSSRRSEPQVMPVMPREQGQTRRLAWIARAVGPRFDMREALREGGTVSSYSAKDIERGDAVVVNVVNPVTLAMLDADRAALELQALVQLRHPQLVHILDAVWTGDILFYVEEPAPGPSLADVLKRDGPMTVDQAVHLVQTLIPPLETAHAAGVVHGDLRPRHIVTADRPRLRSTGVVRALIPLGGIGPSVSAVRIGAPAYLSPEQLGKGQAADVKSDIYALGCILFTALAGEVPFANPNLQNLVSLKLTQPPPSISTMREGIPRELEVILNRMLARLPSERFSSLNVLGDALERLNM